MACGSVGRICRQARMPDFRLLRRFKTKKNQPPYLHKGADLFLPPSGHTQAAPQLTCN